MQISYNYDEKSSFTTQIKLYFLSDTCYYNTNISRGAGLKSSSEDLDKQK